MVTVAKAYFESLHDKENIKKEILVGGAPYLMPAAIEALKAEGMTPLYAISEPSAKINPETGVKTVVFEHKGFVEVPDPLQDKELKIDSENKKH